MNEPMKLKPLPSLFSPPYIHVCFLTFAPFPVQMQNLASYWFPQEISHSPSLFHFSFMSLLPLSLPTTFFPSFVSYLSSPLQSSLILSSLLYPLQPSPELLLLLSFLWAGPSKHLFVLTKTSLSLNGGKITPAAKRVTFSPHYRILGLEMPLEIKHLRGSQTRLVGDDTLGTI